MINNILFFYWKSYAQSCILCGYVDNTITKNNDEWLQNKWKIKYFYLKKAKKKIPIKSVNAISSRCIVRFHFSVSFYKRFRPYNGQLECYRGSTWYTVHRTSATTDSQTKMNTPHFHFECFVVLLSFAHQIVALIPCLHTNWVERNCGIVFQCNCSCSRFVVAGAVGMKAFLQCNWRTKNNVKTKDVALCARRLCVG